MSMGLKSRSLLWRSWAINPFLEQGKLFLKVKKKRRVVGNAGPCRFGVFVSLHSLKRALARKWLRGWSKGMIIGWQKNASVEQKGSENLLTGQTKELRMWAHQNLNKWGQCRLLFLSLAFLFTLFPSKW